MHVCMYACRACAKKEMKSEYDSCRRRPLSLSRASFCLAVSGRTARHGTAQAQSTKQSYRGFFFLVIPRLWMAWHKGVAPPFPLPLFSKQENKKQETIKITCHLISNDQVQRLDHSTYPNKKYTHKGTNFVSCLLFFSPCLVFIVCMQIDWFPAALFLINMSKH